MVHQLGLDLRHGRTGRLESRQRGALEAAHARLAPPLRGPLRLRDPPGLRLAHAVGTGFHVRDRSASRRSMSAQVWFDTHVVGFGVDPTVQLQRWLYRPGLHFWDYLAWACYMTHFFASFIIAGVLWKTNYPKFRRYVPLFVGLTFIGYITYVLYPAMPPWMASEFHHIPPTTRIIDQVLEAPPHRAGSGALRRREQVRQQRGRDALAARCLPDAHLPVLLEGLQPAQACTAGGLPDLHGLLAGVHRRALRDRHLRRMDLRRRHLLLRLEAARPLGSQAAPQGAARRQRRRATRQHRSTRWSPTCPSPHPAEPRESDSAFGDRDTLPERHPVGDLLGRVLGVG